MMSARKVLVVVGATLMSCPISLLVYYGNLLPYLASYFYANREKTTYQFNALWPSATYCICMPLGMMFISPIERRLGIRKSILCTQILISIFILCGFFAIEKPIAFTFVYGALHAAALGASHCLIYKFVFTSVANRGGLAAGLTSIGPGLGSLVNICLAHYVINPQNADANLLVDKTLYFTDSDLLKRVPYYFLASGISTAVLTLSGATLVLIGGDDENQEDKQRSYSRNKEHSTEEMQEKELDEQCNYRRNVMKSCIPTYGGCESTHNAKQKLCESRIDSDPLKQDKSYSSEPNKTILSKTPKNTVQKLDSTVRNIKPVNNLQHEGNAKCVYNFLHQVGEKASKNGSINEQERVSLYHDKKSKKANTSMQWNADKIETNVQIDSKNCQTNTSCVGKNNLQVYRDGVCAEKQTSESDTSYNSFLATKSDLSPWEMVRTRRFWYLWTLNLLLDHAFYIQTNLYKQYGQLFIASDLTLVLTGIISSTSSIIVKPCIGGFNDWYGASTGLVLICFICSIFMNLMVVGAHTSVVIYVIASVISFASVTCRIAVIDLLVALLFGKSHYASNMGLVYTTMCVNIIKPIMVSSIVSAFGWDWVFLSGSASSALALFVALLL